MFERHSVVAVVLMAALILVAGCREVPGTVAPGSSSSAAMEDRDLFSLGGTRYAESIPGTDTYYICEVRFTLPGGSRTYTLEELLALEKQGLLEGSDRVDRVLVRLAGPVPESEVLSGRTTIWFSEPEEEEQPPPCPRCWVWDPVAHECKCETLSCVKCLWR
jgi:hypothetical protein